MDNLFIGWQIHCNVSQTTFPYFYRANGELADITETKPWQN